jgi:2-hydroxy-3-oxopropionate reductase
MTIAFIGTGIMGRPMAGHLAAAGHALRLVKHRSPPAADLLDGGAVVCSTAEAEIVFLMLPDTRDVGNVLFGPDGRQDGDRHELDRPIATQAFAAKIAAKGCV